MKAESSNRFANTTIIQQKADKFLDTNLIFGQEKKCG